MNGWMEKKEERRNHIYSAYELMNGWMEKKEETTSIVSMNEGGEGDFNQHKSPEMWEARE